MTRSCRVRYVMIHTEREKMKIDRLIGILSILLQNEKTTAQDPLSLLQAEILFSGSPSSVCLTL